VIKNKSQYIQEDHYVILIDNKPLDLILHELYPEELFLGLIPTIIDWISLDEESKFVQQRFSINQDCKIVPVLMCPDDCDLSCTIIVAEVVTSDDQVTWQRIVIQRGQVQRITQYSRCGPFGPWSARR
jgi:hypothetical protein